MNCPRCHQAVEPGAAFCGNCGQALSGATPISPIASVFNNQGSVAQQQPYPGLGQLASNGANAITTPAYALSLTHSHNHLKIVLALVCGILGIIAAVFIPLLALLLGVIGLVLATTASAASGKGLKVAGLVLAGLAILAGLAVWVYIADHDPKLDPSAAAHSLSKPAASTSAVTTMTVTTPCYSLSFSRELNITNSSGSCSVDAYNGGTLENSSDVYKVLTTSPGAVTTNNFDALSKKAIVADLNSNFPGSTITGEGSGEFAASPAYFVSASNSSTGVAAEEATVLHSDVNGTTVFVLVHITFGKSTNLSELEKAWHWK